MIQLTVISPNEGKKIIQAEHNDFPRVTEQMNYYHELGALAMIVEYINVLTPNDYDDSTINN